ncbi:30S ribosomal protein S4 [Halorutilales archaeon Cl-col2-1]
MGYPGKNTKDYETPNHPFQGERISDEHRLVDEYGLKNKRELWDAQSELRDHRREARRILGETAEGTASQQVETARDQLVERLRRLGILRSEGGVDDILGLDVTDILERRLQTQVHRKGLANTVDQARQFIAHGHIAVDGKRVTIPSYKVEVDEESEIEFYGNSPLSDDLHPERAGEQE